MLHKINLKETILISIGLVALFVIYSLGSFLDESVYDLPVYIQTFFNAESLEGFGLLTTIGLSLFELSVVYLPIVAITSLLAILFSILRMSKAKLFIVMEISTVIVFFLSVGAQEDLASLLLQLGFGNSVFGIFFTIAPILVFVAATSLVAILCRFSAVGYLITLVSGGIYAVNLLGEAFFNITFADGLLVGFVNVVNFMTESVLALIITLMVLWLSSLFFLVIEPMLLKPVFKAVGNTPLFVNHDEVAATAEHRSVLLNVPKLKSKLKWTFFIGLAVFSLLFFVGGQELLNSFWDWQLNMHDAAYQFETPEWIVFIQEYFELAWSFFNELPSAWTNLVYVVLGSAIIGILVSHGKGAYEAITNWQKKTATSLMYGYFSGSGRYQRELAFTSAKQINATHTSWLYSFSGVAHLLGNYTNDSKLVLFALSVIYVPLAILGGLEMAFRRVLGSFWFLATSLLVRAVLFVGQWSTYLLIPIAVYLDNMMRNTHHCTSCHHTYGESSVPKFKCPHCAVIHDNLTPGDTGVLFARCTCNEKLLPTTILTGRSKLESLCANPDCKLPLAAANPSEFSVQLIGGAYAGKTSFISSFAKQYLNGEATLFDYPNASIASSIGQMENQESPIQNTSPLAASFLLKNGKSTVQNALVIYETDHESVQTGAYTKTPKHFDFTDGIIFIIDPLSSAVVREGTDLSTLGTFSYENDTDVTISRFTQKYSEIKGTSVNRMSNLPVAVIVNKADVELVKEGLNSKSGDERAYLLDAGFDNAVNNIEAVFSNVKYFSVDSLLGSSKTVEPVYWITTQVGSVLSKSLENARKLF